MAVPHYEQDAARGVTSTGCVQLQNRCILQEQMAFLIPIGHFENDTAGIAVVVKHFADSGYVYGAPYGCQGRVRFPVYALAQMHIVNRELQAFQVRLKNPVGSKMGEIQCNPKIRIILGDVGESVQILYGVNQLVFTQLFAIIIEINEKRLIFLRGGTTMSYGDEYEKKLPDARADLSGAVCLFPSFGHNEYDQYFVPCG